MAAPDSHDYVRRYWILAVLCLPQTIVGVTITILNVAIPDLIGQLGADARNLQWIFATYGIVFSGLVVTSGATGDRFGRKRVLDAGLIVFGAAAILGAFAPSPAVLIVARGFMGLGAAMLMPATLSILTTVFPVEERIKAIGIWAGVGALGFIIGPPLGGILLTHFWWGSVMLVIVPVVVVALVAAAAFVPDSRDPARTAMDVGGAALSTLAISTLVYAFIQAPSDGWSAAPVLLAVAVSAVALVCFVVWELHHDHPMLDVRLFRQPTFTCPALVICFGFFLTWGLVFLVPQYLQTVEGRSVLWVGMVLSTISITWCLSATAVVVVVRRLGERAVMSAGLLVTCAGALCLFGLGSAESTLWVIVGLCVIGLGMGSAPTPATTMLVSELPPEKAGVGSAMNDVMREFGTAFGVAVLGSVLSIRYANELAPVIGDLPAGQAGLARNNVGGALSVGREVGGPAGERVAAAARSAFTSGFELAVLVSMAILVTVVLVVVVWLPRARRTRHPDPLATAAVPAG